MKVYCDIEANGLLDTVTKMWCIVCKDIETGKVYTFEAYPYYDPEWHRFQDFAAGVTRWVGHNFVGYDRHVLKRFTGVDIPLDQITDTLILSMMAHPERGYKHALDEWGVRVGVPKLAIERWDEYNPLILERCLADVEITQRVLGVVTKELIGTSNTAVRIEHKMKEILDVQQENGFAVNTRRIQELMIQCEQRADELEAIIVQDFPPKVVAYKDYTPSLVKDGSRLNAASCGPYRKVLNLCVEGGSFTGIKFVPFKLSSYKQVNERLEGMWKPYIRTKKGKSWKLCDENFATIKADAPRSILLIKEYMLDLSRFKMFRTWWNCIGADDRIHGRVISVGCWTHRMRHDTPNTANIPAVVSREGEVQYLGREARECWTVGNPDTHTLLGTDAKGIQLRIVAHYVNNPEYTEVIVNGDIHDKNREWLDIEGLTRPQAKTWVYAWLLGSGAALLAATLGCTTAEAKVAGANILRNAPGLQEFMGRKILIAKQGWFTGLDGRRLQAPSEHLTLASMLQGGEQAIMKMANCIWYKKANDLKLDYKQVATVHDEWQTEVLKAQADQLGALQVAAIVQAGKIFNMNVPLDGEFNTAPDWAGTH